VLVNGTPSRMARTDYTDCSCRSRSTSDARATRDVVNKKHVFRLHIISFGVELSGLTYRRAEHLE